MDNLFFNQSIINRPSSKITPMIKRMYIDDGMKCDRKISITSCATDGVLVLIDRFRFVGWRVLFSICPPRRVVDLKVF